MKKNLYTPAILLFAIAIFACNSAISSGWQKSQRRTIQRALSEYRNMVYLDELTDTQFIIFTNEVTDVIESDYPDYEIFAALPAMSDSVQIYVTTTIVEQLDADGANIRHIYPYRELRRDGVLPAGMSNREQRAFYKCLARKINARYNNFAEFLQAVMADTTDMSQISEMQRKCASQLEIK